jgi:hypothetical protein
LGLQNVPNFAPTSEGALLHLLYVPLLSSCLSLLYLRILIYALLSGTYFNTTIKKFIFFPLFLAKHTKVLQSLSALFFSRFNFEAWEIFLIEAQNVKMVSYLCWPSLLPRQGYCV